jgi:hypothetical protein
MRNKIFISFSFLFLHFLFADAQTAYYSDTAWQVKTPAELKMNKLMLLFSIKSNWPYIFQHRATSFQP